MDKNESYRRMLLKAGLSSAFLASVPLTGMSFEPSNIELEMMGDVGLKFPHKPESTGLLSNSDSSLIKSFARWAITSWEFTGMESYPSSLSTVLKLKTSESPSYLEEYRNASILISHAKDRYVSENEIFLHLLFAGRSTETVQNTRLRRAQKFVYDELVQHIIANGGFRKFGFVNYQGYVLGGSFYDDRSYRREI